MSKQNFIVFANHSFINSTVHFVIPFSLKEDAPVQLRSQLVSENEIVPIRARAHFTRGQNLNILPLLRRRPLALPELHLDFVPDLCPRRQGIVAFDGVHGFLALLDAGAARRSADVACNGFIAQIDTCRPLVQDPGALLPSHLPL